MLGTKETKWMEASLLFIVVWSFGMPWFERIIWYASTYIFPLDTTLTGYESLAFLGGNYAIVQGVFWALVLWNVGVLFWQPPAFIIPAKMLLVGFTLFTGIQTLLAHHVFGNMEQILGGFYVHLGIGLLYIVYMQPTKRNP